MNKLRSALATCAALLAPLTAGAAGLGEIVLQSRLGEPLRAEIPITTKTGERIDSRCFRLVQPAQHELPAVMRGKLLVEGGDQLRLKIIGQRALDEPIAVIAVRFECGVDLQREYVLMPDAPVTAAAAPASTFRPAAASASASPQADGQTRPATSSRRTQRPPRDKAALPPAMVPPQPAARSAAAPAGDRLLLGAAESAGSSATTQALEELDQRLLRMETSLHTLHQEVLKMDQVLALAQQSAAGAATGPLAPTPPRPAPSPAVGSASSPSAGQWLELLLSALLGGVGVVSAAALITRWRQRRAAH